MFHYIKGRLIKEQGSYILNDTLGIEVSYTGTREEGAYFLYPIIDERNKTVAYYAFDNASQKSAFENVLKINGIGPKTAYELAWSDQTKLRQAINTFDLSFFQTIKGIGPKTAKKILVELKTNFSDQDLIKINADDRLIKEITKSLGAMGYDRQKILRLLAHYTESISKDTLPTVIQRLIKEMQ